MSCLSSLSRYSVASYFGALFAILLLWCAPLAAQTVYYADNTDSGAPTSLRYFLSSGVLGDDDTIVFSTSGTVTLTSDLPQIVVDNLTIDTLDGTIDLTIDGNGFQIFSLDNSVIQFTLSRITLENASATGMGGAVYLGTAATQLSLDGTTFQNNTATNQGGAVYYANTGTATLTNTGNTTFIDNRVTGLGGQGGAIDAVGALTLTNTSGGTLSFTGNQATAMNGRGGAISADGNVTIGQGVTFGGALATDGNSAGGGGGAISMTGTALALNGTLFQNNNVLGGAGGAVLITNTGASTLTNAGGTTQFIGNSAINQGGAICAYGALTLSNTGGGTLTFSGNQITGSSGLGGAILAAGDITIGSGVTFDGNSVTAMYGRGGAIYFGSPGTQLSLDGTTFQNNTAAERGGAIDFANIGASTLTNSGNTTFADNTVTDAAGQGGAIRAAGVLTFTNTGGTITFTGNEATGATGQGGAIWADGNVTIGQGVTFGGTLATDGNTAGQHGGAIYVQTTGTSLSLNGTTFQNNTAVDRGGAVNFVNTNATLTNTGNTTFADNTVTDAAGQGGAIRAAGALTLTNNPGGTLTFTGNQATGVWGQGGAIWAAGNVTIGQGVTFGGATPALGNSANQGGAIILGTAATTLSLDGTTFQNNTTTGAGGAVHFVNTNVTLTNTGNTRFIDNTAGTVGAIYAPNALTLTGTGTIAFSGNTATNGGAIYAATSVTLDAGVTLLSDIDTDIWTPTFNLANNATLGFDLTNADNTTTNLIISGDVASAGTTTVSLPGWQTGTFTLITAASGLNVVDFTVDPLSYGSRQTAALSGTATTLILTTTSGNNLDLVWTGTNGNWNTTATGNWHLGGAPASPETFNPDDFVIFDNTSSLLTRDITVAAAGVQVAGMRITGGTYTFSGGSITGVTPISTEQTVTGKLEITGSAPGDEVTFNNAVNFVNGIEIGTDGSATFNSTVTTLGGIEILNDGLAEFNNTVTTSGGMTLGNNAAAVFGGTATRINAFTIAGTGTAIVLFGNTAGTITQTGNLTDVIVIKGSSPGFGPGTLRLDATTMSGEWSHYDGTLELATGRTLTGTFYQFYGNFVAENNTTITGDAEFSGTVQLGATGSAAGSVFNIGGDLIFDGATLVVDVGAGGVSDRINVGGDVTFGANTNILDLDRWQIGTFTVISAASIADPTGLWTIEYRGASLDPTKAQFSLVGTSLMLQTFDEAPYVPILDWDGNASYDPEGMVWDNDTVPADVIVVIGDSLETDLITVDGETNVIAGLLINNDVTIRASRRDGVAVIRGAKSDDPLLSAHRAHGRLRIEGGTIYLDVNTDFEDGTLITGGTIIAGQNETFGIFAQDEDDIENSKGQVTVDGTATIEMEKSLDVQNRFVLQENASLVISVAEGEELNVRGVEVADSGGGDPQLLNGGAIVLLSGSTLTLDGNINISGNSTDLAGGGIFVDPATVIFDSTKGHTAIYDNTEVGGVLNAIALHGGDNTLRFIGGAKALPGGVDIRDSVRAVDNLPGNYVDISYTDVADFVQFGYATHTLNDFGVVDVNKGIMRLVEGATFDAGAEINVKTEGVLAGGGTFIADNFVIQGTLSPDKAVLTTTSSIIGSDKLIGEMRLKGNVELDGAKIAVELKGTDASDKVVIDGTLTYGANSTVDVNLWNEGTFTVLALETGNVDDGRFVLTIGGEVLGSGAGWRQAAALGLDVNNNLVVATEMANTERRRLTWTGGNGNMQFDMATVGNWEGAERFQHTDYLVFNETGEQGEIILGGGRTVSGMLISDGNYTFTGGDLFGIKSVYDTAGTKISSGALIIGGGKIGFANNVYVEGNIEIQNQAAVTLSGYKAFHAEGDFILGPNASLTLAVGDNLIKGNKVSLGGAVYLTDEPKPTTHRRPVFTDMIVATSGGLDAGRFAELFNFTQGLLNREGVVSTDGKSMSLYYVATPLTEYAAEHGFTRNESEVARYLQSTFENWEWEEFELELMGMDDAQLTALFALLSNGAIHADAKVLALSNPYQIVAQRFFEGSGDSRTIDPRHRRCDCSTDGFWLALHHGDRRQNGDGQARQYGISRTGMNVGLDRRITRSFSTGFLFDYSTPHIYQEGSRVKADDYVFGLFARKRFFNTWETNGFIAYGSQTYRGDRVTYDGVARSKYGGDSWYATAELIRRTRLSREFTFLPTMAIDFQTTQTGSFAETGSNQFNQVYEKSELCQTVMRFGLNSQWRMNDRARLDTRLQYGRQVGGSDTPSVRGVLAASSIDSPLMFQGVTLGRDMLNVGVGGRYFLSSAKRGLLFGNYNFDRGNRSLAHSAELGFQFLR